MSARKDQLLEEMFEELKNSISKNFPGFVHRRKIFR